MIAIFFRGGIIKLTSKRLQAKDRAEGLHYYEIRESNETYMPETIEKKADINFGGTVIASKRLVAPVKLLPEEALMIGRILI